MKIAKVLSLLAIATGALSLTGCGYTRVDTGYVALIVDQYGDKRGVENSTFVAEGRAPYNGFTQDILKFPVFQTSTSFAGEDGISVSLGNVGIGLDVDMTYGYRANEQDIKDLVLTYRTNPNDFRNTHLKRAVRACTTSVLTGLELTPITVGSNLVPIGDGIRTCVEDKFPALEISSVSIGSTPRLPAHIQEALENTIKARQEAEQAKERENKERADAAANLAKAKGEADVALTKARAEAEANRLLSASTTPQLVEMARINKWNGEYAPTVQTPSVQLGGQAPAATE